MTEAKIEADANAQGDQIEADANAQCDQIWRDLVTLAKWKISFGIFS